MGKIVVEQATFSFTSTMFKLVCLLVLATLTDLHFVCGDVEFYSAVTQLEGLLRTEEQLLNLLHQYISKEEKKLQEVYEYAEYLRMHNSKAKENTEKYIDNPVNAFLLIKRLSDDWKVIQNLLMGHSPKAFFETLHSSSITLPSAIDMSGSIEALIRIQETYNLNTTIMASGKLTNVKYSNEMTAYDCFTMGMYLHNNERQFTLALNWLQEAEKRQNLEKKPRISKEYIMEYQASCYFYTNNTSKAISIIQELLEFDPKNQRLLETLQNYKISEPLASEAIEGNSKELIMNEYRKLCRGDFRQLTSTLKCFFYKPLKNKFLQLAPFKVEEVSDSPKILVFHDVISDSEIHLLQSLATPRLNRIQSEYSENNNKPAKFRIGQLAWFEDGDHPLFATLSRRIGDMTGLSMPFAERLQVLNYGIGGHGDPHFDYFEVDEAKIDEFVDNRIATVLMYMSDVEQGGATVFPFIGVSIPPKKGSAALWYNLHSNLERDTRTLHGACPVLVGQKWISTKWIRDVHQTFHKPCDLKPQQMKPFHELLSQLPSSSK